MREIATAAGVATGAAYYYFDSKDAIVMAFYQRAQEEMRVDLEKRLASAKNLDERLRAIIEEKLDYFASNRKLLRALSAHTDPDHPLSPFSKESEPIRNFDIHFFDAVISDSKVKLSKDLQPYLPRLLWMYQMGIILYWIYDKSPQQRRTRALFDRSLKMLLLTLKIAAVPLLRPLHKMAAELLQLVYDE